MAVVGGRLLTTALQVKPEALTHGPGLGSQVTPLTSPLTPQNFVFTSPLRIGVSRN